MKIIAAFALFVLGISALPKTSTKIDLRSERLVTDAIASAIQDLSLYIQDAGLDPLHINESGNYALPVPILFSAEGEIVEFLFTGLSEIVINRLNYSVITSRLSLDISLPLVEATLQKANGGAIVFGEKYTASVAGRLAIREVRITGRIQVYVGIISGIAIRNVTLNFSIGGIDSALAVVIQNWDLSNFLNTLLGQTIPHTLDVFSSEINELLEIIALEYISDLL